MFAADIVSTWSYSVESERKQIKNNKKRERRRV